jgi:hypothetical protein
VIGTLKRLWRKVFRQPQEGDFRNVNSMFPRIYVDGRWVQLMDDMCRFGHQVGESWFIFFKGRFARYKDAAGDQVMGHGVFYGMEEAMANWYENATGRRHPRYEELTSEGRLEASQRHIQEYLAEERREDEAEDAKEVEPSPPRTDSNAISVRWANDAACKEAVDLISAEMSPRHPWIYSAPAYRAMEKLVKAGWTPPAKTQSETKS